MTNMAEWRSFMSPEALAEALAGSVAAKLAKAIAGRGKAFIAVSGGTTPKRFFEALSRRELEWDKVTVTLVDERFVPETSPRSNAGLVRETLLVGNAAAARFEPLYRPATSIEEAARQASTDLASMPWPLDVAIL